MLSKRKPSNFSRSRLSRICFLLFVITVGLHMCNYLIQQLTGFNLQHTVGISLLVFPFMFLALSHYFSPTASLRVLKYKSSAHVFWIFIYVHILIVYGLFAGNDPAIIVQEYWTAWIVMFAYSLSVDEQIWNLFEGPIRWIFIIFALLVLLGTTYTREYLTTAAYKIDFTGIPTATVAYEISPILDIWPFLFMVVFFAGGIKKTKISTYLPFIIYLSFQIYFLKRAPSVRALMYLIVSILIYMYIHKSARTIFKLLAVLLLTVLILYCFTPKALLGRFKTEDHARQDEATQLIVQFSPLEHLIGRGMGGSYLLERGVGLIIINDKGQWGKSITHIGAIYPYLKGGLIFLFLVASHVILTVIKTLPRLRQLNPYQLASIVFLIVYSLFRLIEGPLSTGTVFDALLFGMSLGCLNIRKRGIRKCI